MNICKNCPAEVSGRQIYCAQCAWKRQQEVAREADKRGREREKAGRPPKEILWNDERVQLLKDMWTEGATAQQIARALNCGISRSAVLGKKDRLGLSDRASFYCRKRPREVHPYEPKRFLAPMEMPPEPPIEALQLEDGTHLNTLQLRDHHCKWPIGDPQQPNFHYCGHAPKNGAPYCAGHQAIARVYTAPYKKREQ